MLKLERKIGQTIRLNTTDGPITIVLLEVRAKKARIGIDAPGDVAIVRPETEGEESDGRKPLKRLLPCERPTESREAEPAG